MHQLDGVCFSASLEIQNISVASVYCSCYQIEVDLHIKLVFRNITLIHWVVMLSNSYNNQPAKL